MIQGDLENVSLNGLLLRCETVLPEQTPCLVFLHQDGGRVGPPLRRKGRRAGPMPRNWQYNSRD